MKIANCLMIFLLAAGATTFAAQDELINKSEIKQIEEQVIRALQEKKAPAERFYLAYLLGARALKDINMLEQAEKYYLKARDTEAKVDKSEIFLELCNIAYLNKKPNLIKERVKEARDYFSKNQSYEKSIYHDVLEFYEGKKISSVDSPVAKWASQRINENTLEKMIQEKKYVEALQMLNGPSLEKSANLGLQATYDLLRALNQLPLNDRDFLCKQTMDKYPGSYTYSMLVCGAVVEFNRTQKVSAKTIQELEQYFEKYFNNKSYLLNAVKDLATKGSEVPQRGGGQ